MSQPRIDAYKASVTAAESIRQNAVGPGTTQNAARAADIQFQQSLITAAIANGISPSNGLLALRALGGSAPPIGNVSYSDGSAGAPFGTPQYPGLLSNYLVRPPWQVAGVDYYVGCPTNLALKDPTNVANLPSGTTQSGSNVQVTANNVVLDGFDFTIGPTGVTSTAAAVNLTISNSKAISQTLLAPIQLNAATNLTIRNCTINGNGTGGCDILGYLITALSINCTYCYFFNIIDDVFDSATGTNTNHVFRYNLFDQCMFVAGAHADFVQIQFSSVASFVAQYNTIRQTNGAASGQGTWNSGFRIGDGVAGNSINGVDISYNTFAVNGVFDVFGYPIELTNDGGAVITSPVFTSNYVDTTGTANHVLIYPGGTLVTPTISGNINMLNGASQNT